MEKPPVTPSVVISARTCVLAMESTFVLGGGRLLRRRLRPLILGAHVCEMTIGCSTLRVHDLGERC
jgi:hypothetical protein